jgi:hypothetical protein
MSKPTPYYVVMEKPRHEKHERPVWGHPVKGAAEDDAKARTKLWWQHYTYRVAVFVEDISERVVEMLKERQP